MSLKKALPMISQQKETAQHETVHGFTSDANETPLRYFLSLNFIGSFCAIGFGLLAGVAGFGYAAPILGIINADIGPSPYLPWTGIVYTLCVAVGLTLVGRLSDLFGRRYFFIGGSIFGIIGSIICSRAQSIGTLIGGTTLIGLGAATQLSFHFVTAELVPMRARFWSVAIIYIFSIPGSGFGPLIAEAFVSKTTVGWRGVYYTLIGLNTIATLCWSCFYWPPTFAEKNRGRRLADFIKNFDYVGTLLYTAGMTLFLMGIPLGGLSVYPWKSAATLSTLLVGAACLVGLGCWIAFAKPKEPLVPRHIVTNVPFIASAIVLGCGAAVYYALAIAWPQQVAVLYNKGSSIHGGLISSIVGACFILGQMSGGIFCKVIGHVKYQVMFTMTAGGILLGCMATCTPDTPGRAMGLLIVACVLVGWTESVCLTLLTITINDQQEVGTAGGIGASMRSGIATICQTIYIVALTSKLTQAIPAKVPAAAISAGLPQSSVISLLTAFGVGTPAAFSAVPGITPQILSAASRAYKEASSEGYRVIYLTSIAFSGLAVLLSFFVKDVEDRMTSQIAATLSHGTNTYVKEEKMVEMDEAHA